MNSFKEYFYKLDEAYDVSKSDKSKFKKKSLFKIKKKSHFDLPQSKTYKLGKRPNKTQQARDFLFKKQGIKKAKARTNGKYVLDHTQIKDLMSGMGLEFNPKAGKWGMGKGGGAHQKKKEVEKPKTPSIQNIQQQIQKQKQEVLDNLPDPRDPNAPPPPEPDDLIEVPDEFDSIEELEEEGELEDTFAIGKDGDIYHITEREVMIFQGRFLLGLVWEEFSYSEYRLEPDGTVWATQSRGDTLRAMDALTTKWSALDDTWHTSVGVQVFRLRINHNETKKTVVGRGLLANMNFIEFIQFDEKTKRTKMGIDDVNDQLEKQDFHWNDEDEEWHYVGEDHRADFGNISHGEEEK
jgi:hypothetical protein